MAASMLNNKTVQTSQQMGRSACMLAYALIPFPSRASLARRTRALIGCGDRHCTRPHLSRPPVDMSVCAPAKASRYACTLDVGTHVCLQAYVYLCACAHTGGYFFTKAEACGLRPPLHMSKHAHTPTSAHLHMSSRMPTHV